MATTYTSEFKAIITQAIALGASVQTMGKLHNVPESTIRGWVKRSQAIELHGPIDAETPVNTADVPASEPDAIETTEIPVAAESSPEVIRDGFADSTQFLPPICGGSPDDTSEAHPDDDTTECHHCGERYASDSMTECEGNEYCEECFSEQFSYCDRCNATVPNDEIRSTPGDDCYCERCHEDNVTTCDHCGNEVWSDGTLTTGSGDEICRECHENQYFTCEGCGEIFHCDHSHSTDDGTYCEDCEPEKSGPIRDYSTRVDSCGLRFFGKPKDKVFFGVELEVCASSVNSRVDSAEDVLERMGDDFVILKEDGSLPDAGFEIVTTPATIEHHAERFRRLMIDRPVVGLKSWDASGCGMHVHVSRKPLSQLTIGKMLVFVNDSNNADFITAIAGRDANTYCRRYDKKITDVKRGYPERYEAINLQNSATIEFRIFKGTLKYESFMKNIEFVASVVAFCRIAGIRDVDRNHYLDFLESRKASYPHLYSFLASKGFVPVSKRVPVTAGAER